VRTAVSEVLDNSQHSFRKGGIDLISKDSIPIRMKNLYKRGQIKCFGFNDRFIINLNQNTASPVFPDVILHMMIYE
jgi:hypothetical protein